MPDTPEHGPGSATPPDGPGDKDETTAKSRKKGTKGGRRRKGATKATAKAGKGKKRRRTPRGSKADVVHLTTLVVERLLLGERRGQIMRYLADAVTAGDLKWPDKSGPAERTVERYIAEATIEIRKLSSVDRSEAMSAARGRFMMIMKKAEKAGDLSTLRLANRDLARIDGLEPVHVRHSGSVITEHTGVVAHTHDVTVRPASIEEQTGAIKRVFDLANARRVAAAAPPPATGNPSNN